jgi:RNA polymerase sigma-70 factor, ECF subfamily
MPASRLAPNADIPNNAGDETIPSHSSTAGVVLSPELKESIEFEPEFRYNPSTTCVAMTIYSSLSIEELARRCSSPANVDAWEEFVGRLHSLIAKVVNRIAARMGDRSRQTVDDLIQETYLRLCANDFRILRNFEHRHEGAFIGYVQVIAANVTRDHFRLAHVRKAAQSLTDDVGEEKLPPSPAESAGGIRAMEREVLIREVEYHLDRCTEGPDQDRNRKVFWLYYRTGLSASEIAALPGIGLATKGVESLILRLGRELRCRLAAASVSGRGPSQQSREGIQPAESF